MPRLTDARIRDAKYKGRSVQLRDSTLPGFFVDVNKNSKSYKVQADLYVGERGRRRLVRTVRKTLGRVGEVALDDARVRAMGLLADIKRGVDPAKQTIRAEGWTVGQLWDEYEADMTARQLAPVSVSGFRYALTKYLADWRNLSIAEVKRSMCRSRHGLLTQKHGKTPANRSLQAFRTAYNFAMRVIDDPDSLPPNPTAAVTFHRERSSDKVILPDDLPRWWAMVCSLNNPVRRCMHQLGLFSGLRPGRLVTLEKDWVDLDHRAIRIPRMKSGRRFDLPLSNRMLSIVNEVLEVGTALYGENPYVFPSRSNDGRRVIATATWKEKALPSETGHILRHTYRSVAKLADVDDVDAKLLLDHKVQGMDGVYLSERALFGRLLKQQSTISSHLERNLKGHGCEQNAACYTPPK